MQFYTKHLKNSQDTITYVVKHIEKENDKVVAQLSHPLAPEIFILEEATSLEELESNNLQTTGKSNSQRQLEYVKKYVKYLNYDQSAQLDALCIYFVFKQNLTSSLKAMLSTLCGKIATVYCNGDITIAIRIIKENKALLDSYNLEWVDAFKNHIDKGEPVLSKGKRIAIFNIAGFVLAQLENV